MKKLLWYIVFLLGLVLPGALQAQCWVGQLASDLSNGSEEFKAYIKNSDGAFEAYKKLYTAGKTQLRKNAVALAAFDKASKNAKLKELGFTDDLLADVNGYTDASFADLMNDLDNFGNAVQSRSISVENFKSMIDILKGGNANYRQGIHWILQDLIADAATFNNRTIKLEERVANARETFSSIDLFCSNCSPPNLKIEYKSGPGSITVKSIKEQFIERDLFNAAELNQIQWRMKNTDLTLDKLKTWMKDNKESINNLLANQNTKTKIKSWFKLNDFENAVTDLKIEQFVDNNYALIFK